MTENILCVRDLKKTYHTKNGTTVDAVKGISFEVKRGEIFGFLGANGAGKSTTISMLTTQLRTSGGDAYHGGPVSGRADHRSVPELQRAPLGADDRVPGNGAERPDRTAR